MPAYPSWFRVHPRTVLAQAVATSRQLADPALTVPLLDLQVVGVHGATLRRTVDGLRDQLRAHLDWQADAEQRLSDVQAERAEAVQVFFAWRARLFARLRFAARRGADPEGAFSQVFGYRSVPRPRAAGLVSAGHAVFAALAEREASLRPYGIDPGFVGEGRAAHERLSSLQVEVAEGLTDRKAATRAVHAACADVKVELLALVAADDAAALEMGRAPAFALAVLRPPT